MTPTLDGVVAEGEQKADEGDIADEPEHDRTGVGDDGGHVHRLGAHQGVAQPEQHLVGDHHQNGDLEGLLDQLPQGVGGEQPFQSGHRIDAVELRRRRLEGEQSTRLGHVGQDPDDGEGTGDGKDERDDVAQARLQHT